MALIDIDKFVASIMYRWNNTEMKTIFNDMKYSLIDQGLEYKDNKIVKTQRRVSAEAKENGYGESEDEKVRKELLAVVNDLVLPDEQQSRFISWLEKQGTSYAKRDVDDAYVEGMAFAKDELEKQGEQKKHIDDLTQQEAMDIAVAKCFEQGEQKLTNWSEDDEERFQSCLNILQVQAKGFMGITETINTKWLKSIKNRIKGK